LAKYRAHDDSVSSSLAKIVSLLFANFVFWTQKPVEERGHFRATKKKSDKGFGVIEPLRHEGNLDDNGVGRRICQGRPAWCLSAVAHLIILYSADFMFDVTLFWIQAGVGIILESKGRNLAYVADLAPGAMSAFLSCLFPNSLSCKGKFSDDKA
jgi:hypothetical protein